MNMKYPKLTKAEEDIMQMMWEEPEACTVSHLISQMSGPQPPHSTISSIVRILEKKGLLNHKTYGRTHVYYPIIEKKVYTKLSVSHLIGKYFEGSMSELVSFLVKEDDLSIKDLGEIIKKLENE
jgi:BlaI family penicillinase repressor